MPTKPERCLEIMGARMTDLGVTVPALVRLPINGLVRVLHLCFDNPMADLWVHHQIGAGQEELEILTEQIDQVRTWLVALMGVTSGRLQDIETERLALLCP